MDDLGGFTPIFGLTPIYLLYVHPNCQIGDSWIKTKVQHTLDCDLQNKWSYTHNSVEKEPKPSKPLDDFTTLSLLYQS